MFNGSLTDGAGPGVRYANETSSGPGFGTNGTSDATSEKDICDHGAKYSGKCEVTILHISQSVGIIFQYVFASFYLVSLLVVFILYTLIYRSVVKRRQWRWRQKSKPSPKSAITAMTQMPAEEVGDPGSLVFGCHRAALGWTTLIAVCALSSHRSFWYWNDFATVRSDDTVTNQELIIPKTQKHLLFHQSSKGISFCFDIQQWLYSDTLSSYVKLFLHVHLEGLNLNSVILVILKKKEFRRMSLIQFFSNLSSLVLPRHCQWTKARQQSWVVFRNHEIHHWLWKSGGEIGSIFTDLT